MTMNIATSPRRNSSWHTGFLALMPDIACRASRAFSHLRAQARADAVQDVVINAMLAYVRLFRRGKTEKAFPSVLGRFAIAQYRVGRRSGEKLNCRDVLSPYAKRMKGIQIESLDLPGSDSERWREILIEDRDAGPAETAAARIDMAAWFQTLNRRDRRIAKALSYGCTTHDVAKRFRVSPARISQKRRELFESWQAFQGQPMCDTSRELVPAFC